MSGTALPVLFEEGRGQVVQSIMGPGDDFGSSSEYVGELMDGGLKAGKPHSSASVQQPGVGCVWRINGRSKGRHQIRSDMTGRQRPMVA